jgi:hypothetical protein
LRINGLKSAAILFAHATPVKPAGKGSDSADLSQAIDIPYIIGARNVVRYDFFSPALGRPES